MVRTKLAQEHRAGLDRRAVRFGVVNAHDLLVTVREHTRFPAVAHERSGIEAQFRKDAQQGGITEQVHRIDV